jgi:hypothetical protein
MQNTLTGQLDIGGCFRKITQLIISSFKITLPVLAKIENTEKT